MNTNPFHLLFFSQKNARPQRPVNAPSTQFFRRYKELLALALVLTSSAFTFHARAQEPDVKEKTQKEVSLELYGFIMMDAGHNYNQIDPNWFDVMRPTKLPAYQNQYGADGFTYFSVRQTRFGVKGYLPTKMGMLKTTFEFEMFGTGVDAGQTTIRLRHAYGELGKWGAGQTWSPFMDIDVFPNSLEYWGPNGMAFFRNVQIRYMPIQGDTRMTIALERPGASADQGDYAGHIELQGVKPQLDLPDLSAEYRIGGKPWGYVELAAIARNLKWKDIDSVGKDLSDQKLGWGVSLSSGLKLFKKDILHLQVVYGEGCENYMNDAPADVGIKTNNGAIEGGVALPMLGAVAFLDHVWNPKFSTTLGYSMLDIDNSNGQAPSAFKKGQYALANLIYYPVTNVLVGIEFQYGKRDNFSDGWSSDGFKTQITFKYNFSEKFYRDSK